MESCIWGVTTEAQTRVSRFFVYGSKEDLMPYNAMVGFYLIDLYYLRMLARVPIISAYVPRRVSMLAYASPSYKIAIMITGLVIDCLGTNNFLLTTSSLLKLI